MQEQAKTVGSRCAVPPEPPSGVPSGSDETSHAFRAAMRRMAATVTIISTEYEGTSYGMTATAVTSVSMEPPSLLVCVNNDASICTPLSRSDQFCINILAAGQDDHCYTFSGRKSGEERFESGIWNTAEGIPYLADAQANVFCRVDERIPYGTHTVFIGRVTHVRVQDHPRPLVYINGVLTHGFAPSN